MKKYIDKETFQFLGMVSLICLIMLFFIMLCSSCTVTRKPANQPCVSSDPVCRVVLRVTKPNAPRDTFCLEIDTCVMNDPCFGIHCDDLNACTFDRCEHGECDFEPIPDCGPKLCDTTICTDGSACTLDTCSNVTGCAYIYAGEVICDDQSFCTSDVCYTYPDHHECRHFVVRNCDDENPCTVDGCIMHGCNNLYVPDICDDWDACTVDSCIAFAGCSYQLIDCDDFNECTTDICNDGHCLHIPVDCNDGDDCTEDSCYNGIMTGEGCVHDDTCTTPCAFDTLPRPGSDNWCKIVVCVNGDVFNSYRTEDDANLCTHDLCNPMGGFYHPPVWCEDGTGISFCCNPADGNCQWGDELCCNDHNACTMEDWNEMTNTCDHYPIDCNPGNGQPYWCDTTSGCVYASPKTGRFTAEVPPVLYDVMGRKITTSIEDLPPAIYYLRTGVTVKRIQLIGR